MNDARIAIIGGGLSGLVAAYLLEQRGINDYLLVEARATCGGRILSVPASAGAVPDGAERYDLGPTWCWPQMHPELDALMRTLGLESFAQYDAGDMVYERTIHERPQRVRAYATSPTSMRLKGGMGALVDALRARIPDARVCQGKTVQQLRCDGDGVEVFMEGADGERLQWRVKQVLLALPPRLAASTMAFEPRLPDVLARQWGAVDTWMAPHAKYVAVYASPFWREHGLSGSARSAVGPLTEIHDASMPGHRAALFGFMGMPAETRASMSEDSLKAHCRAQLGRLFGQEALNVVAEYYKDWARDQYTATAQDLVQSAEHGVAPSPTPADGPWQGRLTGIASEWSRNYPGYLAGALDAATHGVDALVGRGDGGACG